MTGVEQPIVEQPVIETLEAESVEETARKAWEEIQGAIDEDQESDDVSDSEGTVGQSDAEVSPGDAGEPPEKEEGEEGQEADSQKEETKPRDPQGRFSKQKGKKQKSQEVADVEPPVDFKAEAKEAFRKYPLEAKQEIARISREYQQFRRAGAAKIQEVERSLQQKSQEIDGVVNVVRRFLPMWGEIKITPEQAVTELCTFNHKVINNPDAALEELAAKTGRQIEIKNRATPQNNSQSAFTEYDRRLRTIESGIEAGRSTAHEQQVATLADQIKSTYESLRDEFSGDRYTYPDLHDESFLQGLQPLFESIVRSNPKLSFRDAMLRAYRATEGRINPKNSVTNRPRPTQANGVMAAKRANSSISGISGGADIQVPVNQNESPEETATKVWDAMFGSR